MFQFIIHISFNADDTSKELSITFMKVICHENDAFYVEEHTKAYYAAILILFASSNTDSI